MILHLGLRDSLRLIDDLLAGKTAWSYQDILRLERLRTLADAPVNVQIGPLTVKQIKHLVGKSAKRIEWRRNGRGAARLTGELNAMFDL